MKITIYELLGMIKDGKAPKKIKTGNIIYELDDEEMIWADEIYHEINKEYIWLNFKHIKSLNDEVEIIEPQEHKIPEKICTNRIINTKDILEFEMIQNKINAEYTYAINEILDYLEANNGIMD